MLLVVAFIHVTLYKFWTTPLYDEKYNMKVWRPSTYNLDSFKNFVVIIFVILTLFGNNNERISYYSVRFFQATFFWNKKKNHMHTPHQQTIYLTPWDQICLLSLVSTRTSGVPIIFSANLRISLIARGALFLNPLQNKSN